MIDRRLAKPPSAEPPLTEPSLSVPAVTTIERRPDFLGRWPTAYPHHRRPWTVCDHDGRWGSLDPANGQAAIVDPAADRRLPALATALERGRLVGYRVGRRAVVATADSYIKVIRPQRVESLARIHRWMASSGSGFATPRLLSIDPTGSLELELIEGDSLHSLLRRPTIGRNVDVAIEQVATALAALHETPPPAWLPAALPDDPQRWLEIVNAAEPQASHALARVAADLPPRPVTQTSVIHGDLHDKNVFHRTDGAGLIDLDGVGRGVAEDDVANLAVHLRLRSLQAGHPHQRGEASSRRLYQSYRAVRPLDADVIQAVERHTWFRLACLYRFRAGSRHLVPHLLSHATGQR